MNITFENFQDVCKYQDVILVKKPTDKKVVEPMCYCDYVQPSIFCNEKDCPVLKELELIK